MTSRIDHSSIAGKLPAAPERTQLLVVGAGPSGVAAASEAARAGLSVVLVDEHPVDAALMGLDVPFFFGQRMDASVQNRGRLLDRIASSNPGIDEAFALGVDVRLATDAWGLFANGPGTRSLPERLAGLCENGKVSFIGFDRVIVAAGRRDLVVGFPGWNIPGVMGAVAAHTLIERYGAFRGRRVAVLGSGVEALRFAERALERGIEIAAIVDVVPGPQGSDEAARRLSDAGVPLMMSTVPIAAEGRELDVTALRVAAVDENLKPIAGSESAIACDTICMAIGVVPNVEALDVLGCALEHRSELGGFVPKIDSSFRTAIDFAYAVGDCAGVFAEKSLDARIAQDEGRTAALAAALVLGALDPAIHAERLQDLSASPLRTTDDTTDYRMAWVRAIANAGGGATLVCQCEEVTRDDLLGVRPPRYLGRTLPRIGVRDLATLGDDGPVNPDQIKRLTRAGMGPCQGRRCREQIAMILSAASGAPLPSIALARYRPPLRPLPLASIGAVQEGQEMSAHWEIWYAIESQWRPYWEVEKSGGTELSA